MNNYEILIIDGSYLLHRAHTAPYKLTTTTGLDSKAIHNFMRSLLSIYKTFRPQSTAICWESYGTPSWRKILNKDYKANRSVDNGYLDQSKDIKVLLHLLNIKQFYAPANEADDVIATLVTKYTNNKSVVIFTKDKDLMQLVTNNIPPVHMYDGKEVIDETKVYHKFGVFPYQICDYLSLSGDGVDNIKGVEGIGEKKAVKLLKDYDNIESIPIEKFPKGKESFFQAIGSKKLVTLNHSAQVKALFGSEYFTNETVDSILNKYELKSVQKTIENYRCIGDNK